MSLKVAFTDSDQDMTLTKELLHKAGLDYVQFQVKKPEEIIKACQGMEVLISQYAQMTREVIENIPSLKLIIRSGVGVDSVDLEAAKEKGVRVCNVPDGSTIEVAEHALCLLLSIARKIVYMDHKVHEGHWTYKEAIPLYRLRGSTVGVIGIGRIGTEFARLANAIGMKVIAYDKFATSLREDQNFMRLVDLDTLLATSDFISVNCPLNGNVNLICEKELEKMKSNCCIVNVSRGGIINEDDLYKALAANTIRGAAMDVATKEPIPKDNPLLTLDNYICTPHIAFYSTSSADTIATKVVEEVVRYAKGENLRCVVV